MKNVYRKPLKGNANIKNNNIRRGSRLSLFDYMPHETNHGTTTTTFW